MERKVTHFPGGLDQYFVFEAFILSQSLILTVVMAKHAGEGHDGLAKLLRNKQIYYYLKKT